MIIKGKSRSGPGALAAHLGNAEKNERIQLIETRGTVAQDLRGALIEMDALAAGTRCQRPLYHAAMSPEPPHRLTPEQRLEAVEALEAKLGLVGHARVVVLHEKLGREHVHIVWSRIDLERMVSVSDSHNYRKHEEVARELERRFGHDRVQGAHHERDGVERPDRTPSRPELRQEERTGIKGKDVKAEVTAAYQSSDGAEAFRSALETLGYVLARGDRRDYVVIDREGGIHSLGRRIDGVKAAQLREFMAPLDQGPFPDVEEARALQARSDMRIKQGQDGQEASERERERERREAMADDKVEAAYGRGDDYVSQTRAAQKDHKRRQRDLDKDHAEAIDGTWLASVELTDEAREKLSQFGDDRQSDGADQGGPSQQNEVPGGGRPRDR